MILTEDYLARLASGADIINESAHETRYFSNAGNATVFLSHKHDDLANLKRVVYILEKLHSNVYVDWLDKSMPKITCGETAVKIKDKIRKMDKFILVASDAAIESKWCNWELGFGDAQKYDRRKIALFPICKVAGEWKGNEYMSIYPTIEYFDGKNQRYSNTNGIIPEGYYYRYKGDDGTFYLRPLLDWLIS